jgi:hypothetical protein
VRTLVAPLATTCRLVIAQGVGQAEAPAASRACVRALARVEPQMAGEGCAAGEESAAVGALVAPRRPFDLPQQRCGPTQHQLVSPSRPAERPRRYNKAKKIPTQFDYLLLLFAVPVIYFSTALCSRAPCI